MSKRQLDSDNENKENEEPNAMKKIKTSDINENPPKPQLLINVQEEEDEQDEEESEEDEEDEEDEEENEPIPIGAVIVNNPGQRYPENPQYYLYQNTVPTMISNTARFWIQKCLKVLPHINPDRYDMYIHNDFVCYGELEIIENCLIDIIKGIFLKRRNPASFAHYVTSFRRVEGLTVLLDCTNNFPGMDDGERFVHIVRVIGACYVTILRDLLPKSMFTNEELSRNEMRKLIRISQQVTNFKQILQQALILGHSYLTIGDVFSGYTNILQHIYRKWSLLIDNNPIDLNAKPTKKDEYLWKVLQHAASLSNNAFDETFDFLKEFENYAATYSDLGGHSHDLRRWSKAQRDLYSYDNDSDEDEDEDFWFRL